MSPRTQARAIYYSVIFLLIAALVLSHVSVTLGGLALVALGSMLWSLLNLVYEIQLTHRRAEETDAETDAKDAPISLDAGR